MLSQLTEQVKKSSQPASDLFAANLKVLQAVSKQQAELMSGMLGDSMKMMQSVGEQTEVNGILAVQSVYAESLRERLTASSKTTFGTLSAAGQQFADTMKASFDLSANTAADAPAKAPVKVATKKVSAKKAETKKATVTTSSTAAKAAVKSPITAAKTTTAKKVAVKKASTASTKAAAPVSAKIDKVANAVKASPKKVAKPLPTLSADNVRATPKQAAVDTVSETSVKQSGTSKA